MFQSLMRWATSPSTTDLDGPDVVGVDVLRPRLQTRLVCRLGMLNRPQEAL